jgi:phosphatidylserine/phosphatidylglycerophosphate/cardiolipin synthase-like enzyme
MRDHRKIVLYDVSEQDPGRGQAIYTGMGVGEHYTGSTWEDRAILVRGPALVALKDATREALLKSGV